MLIGTFTPSEEKVRPHSDEPKRSSSARDDVMDLAHPHTGSLSAGNFRAEAHSNWIIDFKDLVGVSAYLHAQQRVLKSRL